MKLEKWPTLCDTILACMAWNDMHEWVFPQYPVDYIVGDEPRHYPVPATWDNALMARFCEPDWLILLYMIGGVCGSSSGSTAEQRDKAEKARRIGCCTGPHIELPPISPRGPRAASTHRQPVSDRSTDKCPTAQSTT
jgi:hypothetical protein